MKRINIILSRKAAEELVDLEDKLMVRDMQPDTCSREERIQDKMKPLGALFG